MKGRTPWIVALVFAALVAGFLALPQPGDRAAPPAAGFAVRDVRVFDGERVLEHVDVLVREGRIAAIGARLAIPVGLEVVDGAGRTLLPGLIDAHVHAYGDALPDAIAFGVTTEFEMFGDPATLRELKPAREAYAPRRSADLWSAGYLATVPGGHGTQFGLPVPTLSTPAEAPAWVRARLAEGSDWIKLVYEPRDAGGHGPPFPSLDLPTVSALIAATHAQHRLAVAHISRLEPARAVVAAGIDGLVHVFGDRVADDAFVAAARERRVFVTPTLAVIAAFGGGGEGASLAADPRIAPYLTPDQRRTLEQHVEPVAPIFSLQHALETVRRLHAAGVPILAGTDAPNPGTAHGASLHQELSLLVRAGLTPTEALTAATAAPARAYGIADRGRIAPGARADLLLVDGDPTTDISASRALERIWKNGAPVERRRYARESR